MSAQAIPKGYRSITPTLTVRGVDKEIRFLKEAFGATQKMRHTAPDGSVMHAEVVIGDSVVMLGEANEHCEPTTASLYLYVPDVDTAYQRALKAGATSTMEVTDMFYGDRFGSVKDFAGNTWNIATHKEDVSEEELKKRMKKFFAEQQSKQQPNEHAQAV